MANNAAEFSIELDKIFDEHVEGQVLTVLQKLAMEGLSRMVLKSPVDTGRFRGNWTVSVGNADLSTSEGIDPNGGATIARGSVPILAMSEPKVVWMLNSLPYANRLENGWSKQAPAGVVAVTVAELTAFFR